MSQYSEVFKKRRKNVMYVVDNSFLLSTVKNFQNWLTTGEVIAKSSAPRFLQHSVAKIR